MNEWRNGPLCVCIYGSRCVQFLAIKLSNFFNGRRGKFIYFIYMDLMIFWAYWISCFCFTFYPYILFPHMVTYYIFFNFFLCRCVKTQNINKIHKTMYLLILVGNIYIYTLENLTMRFVKIVFKYISVRFYLFLNTFKNKDLYFWQDSICF
jgi:hypothetical protein